ncbi:DUF975 family protein [Companilactobacillus mishanensis]|uniref:DUF975 family protein n=1 Tax=Companilactobacillus mishanensis TaxID=2486008 RepID=A0A5P0ZHY6_9LACO|nr:DUF975 family protein [Companilactobacillus mishanensis]MQS45098.1 DUF975 family protein [Companilactobacillus mishanensis]MQS52654.1 DUF975 family protein [Companilactobacillus mishanensis]MQS90154.1 DUF975 family protein [Companilactobacillus mishanensis]
MQNYKTRYQLKKEVKSLLAGRWGDGILLFILPYLFIFILSSGNVWVTVNGPTYHSTTGVGTFLISMFVMLLAAGAMFRGIDWVRNPELQFQALESNFSLFRNPDWWKVILISLLTYVFTFLWSLLLIIPGIIKGIAYSQAFYIYKDLRDKGQAGGYQISDYITKSRQLMDGHKADYFVLQLSFLGWVLLGIVTFGIALIWIVPYYNLTMANFYRDLIDNNDKIV